MKTHDSPRHSKAEHPLLTGKLVPQTYSSKGKFRGRLIFRVLRDTVDIVVMTTDPERVREVLGALESERSVTHD